jgi:hypothetical protein
VKTSIPRLRRIRFKDGRTIEVFRRRTRTVQLALQECTKKFIDADHDNLICGFALVAWDTNGEVLVHYENQDGSLVQSGQVPQFVKDCLLAEVAVRWTKD